LKGFPSEGKEGPLLEKHLYREFRGVEAVVSCHIFRIAAHAFEEDVHDMHLEVPRRLGVFFRQGDMKAVVIGVVHDEAFQLNRGGLGKPQALPAAISTVEIQFNIPAAAMQFLDEKLGGGSRFMGRINNELGQGNSCGKVL